MVKIPLIILTFWASQAAVSQSNKTTIPLTADQWKEVSFDDIPKTLYKFEQNAINMQVKKSSSFLLHPFEQIHHVASLSFEFKSTGTLNVKDAKEEQSKKGDDFAIKLGLVLSGDAPFIPFFAPGWIKAIRDIAKLPSDKVVYYVANTKSKAGQTWESPYSSSLFYAAIACPKVEKSDWKSCKIEFSPAKKVVGLWLMADGDNTKSSFESTFRNLKLTVTKKEAAK